VTVFLNEKGPDGKDIGIDFKCESYSLDVGWVSIRMKDRAIHLPAYRIKEVQATEATVKPPDVAESRSA
jgi:hypothetical protein